MKICRSSDWNNPDGIKCAKETSPILNTTTPPFVGTDRRLFTVATNVIQSMKHQVHFQNITTISEYRKDAHTSIYTVRQGKLLTDEQKANPAIYADCTDIKEMDKKKRQNRTNPSTGLERTREHESNGALRFYWASP
ncbi:ESKIMO 1-like protein [Tanacetum coccineum]